MGMFSKREFSIIIWFELYNFKKMWKRFISNWDLGGNVLYISNKFEEDFIKFWKKNEVYNYDKKFGLFNGVITIGLMIVVVFVSNCLIELLSKFFDNKDYIIMTVLLILILVSLVIIFNLKSIKNKNLLRSRNLKKIYDYLSLRNIKSYDDYSMLIARFEDKNKAIEYNYIIDDSLSKVFISIGSFFGGGFFKDVFEYISKGSKNTVDIGNNINVYFIFILASIFLICICKLVLETFNLDNNSEKDNLIIIIDDLKNIQYQIKMGGIQNKKEKSVLDIIDNTSKVLVSANLRLERLIKK